MLPALLALDFQALQFCLSTMVAPANCSGRLRFPAVPIQASGFSCWAMPQTRGACAELPRSSISSLWAARKRNALFSNPRAGLGWRRTNHGFQDIHGCSRRRAMLGQAKLALCFQIPSQASLHGILKPHRSFCCANGPAMLRQKSLGENAGLRLVSKRGCFVKMHPQACLRVSFP